MAVTMKSLEALLDKKFKEFEAKALTPVKETIDGMEASLNFMSKQQDDMAKSLKDLQDKNKFLETENSLLLGQLAAVQNDINQQKDALNEYEQYSRRECLEFCGIGKRPIEDTNKIILTIGDALGVQINEEDISVSHRLPQYKHNVDKPPIIIAKFVRRDTKENLYRARSKLRHITTQDLGFQGDNKIYIQESLTQKNKELFRKALQLKKSLKYKFIWTNSGRIYLRKDESPESPIIYVKSTKDLEKLQQSG